MVVVVGRENTRRGVSVAVGAGKRKDIEDKEDRRKEEGGRTALRAAGGGAAALMRRVVDSARS